MKSLKYAILAILALGIAAPIASAQGGDSAKKGRQGQSQRGGGYDFTAALLKDITLTADQQKKVDKIRTDAQNKLQGLSQEERRSSKGREITTDARAKIRDVLTDEQKKIFDKNIADSRRSGGGGKGEGKGSGGKGQGGKGGGKKKGGGGE
jgi:Spy/CpxP family protein refolding chaperone